MTHENSIYPKDWIGKAEKDWRRVRLLLDGGDVEGAAFHLHQALEKFLKGYLLAKGWKLRRIHDLEVLLKEAVRYEPEWIKYEALCQRAKFFYLERYPLMTSSTLDRAMVDEVVSQSGAWIEDIGKEVP
ncbi:MAG: HEPN domain-containing protein [Elusimicrobia bacterium]|nr:HEPN domain-containing protein [Elusimicrobiota bacterium]